MPLIEVHEVRSFGEVPSIDITFPNGMKDSMTLQRFYPTEESILQLFWTPFELLQLKKIKLILQQQSCLPKTPMLDKVR